MYLYTRHTHTYIHPKPPPTTSTHTDIYFTIYYYYSVQCVWPLSPNDAQSLQIAPCKSQYNVCVCVCVFESIVGNFARCHQIRLSSDAFQMQNVMQNCRIGQSIAHFRFHSCGSQYGHIHKMVWSHAKMLSSSQAKAWTGMWPPPFRNSISKVSNQKRAQAFRFRPHLSNSRQKLGKCGGEIHTFYWNEGGTHTLIHTMLYAYSIAHLSTVHINNNKIEYFEVEV